MQQATLHVTGMFCQFCVQSVAKALEEIGAAGQVDLERGVVVVEYDENKVALAVVKDAIEDLGYDVA